MVDEAHDAELVPDRDPLPRVEILEQPPEPAPPEDNGEDAGEQGDMPEGGEDDLDGLLEGW